MVQLGREWSMWRVSRCMGSLPLCRSNYMRAPCFARSTVGTDLEPVHLLASPRRTRKFLQL